MLSTPPFAIHTQYPSPPTSSPSPSLSPSAHSDVETMITIRTLLKTPPTVATRKPIKKCLHSHHRRRNIANGRPLCPSARTVDVFFVHALSECNTNSNRNKHTRPADTYSHEMTGALRHEHELARTTHNKSRIARKQRVRRRRRAFRPLREFVALLARSRFAPPSVCAFSYVSCENVCELHFRYYYPFILCTAACACCLLVSLSLHCVCVLRETNSSMSDHRTCACIYVSVCV